MRFLRSILVAAAVLFPGLALAQSGCSYIAFGAVLTAAQWNLCFSQKNDNLGYVPLSLGGGTLSGSLITAPLQNGLVLSPVPNAPGATPPNGSIWTTLTGVYAQINGATVGPLGTGGGGGGTPGGSNLQVQYNNAGAFGGYTNVQLTALIQPATASLSGALPAWPNNVNTFLNGAGNYASVPCGALPALTGNVTTPVGSCTTTLGGTIPVNNQVAALSLVTPTGTSTITSGTYNSGSGLVTLTLSGALSIGVGTSVTVTGATGTGSFASINGSFTAGAGSGGVTVTYSIATSLTMTITGATVANGTWNTSSLAALTINAPSSPTTENFLSGILVNTNAASVDKGRGIFVHNTGASDSIYVQLDGASASGEAILMQTGNTNGTGLVIGTTLNTQNGFIIQEETDLVSGAGASNLVLIRAVAGAAGPASQTQMLGMLSDVTNQIGIISVMTAASALPLVIQNSQGTTAQLNNTGNLSLGLSGTQAGSVTFLNGTSGSITLEPPLTGALGSSVLQLPAATGTLAVASAVSKTCGATIVVTNGVVTSC